MPDIGDKIKKLRRAKQMTLKLLASKAGCTDAYISQIERGRANPSLMILKKISSALDVNVVDFFVCSETTNNDVVINEAERISMNFKRGFVKSELLVKHVQDRRMQPFYTSINPGGGSRGSYSHFGEEFGFVLEGELQLDLGNRQYRIKKNGSFYFSSQEPHSFSNPGKKKTVVLWVVSPPSF
jgi:transcriptional regulator with XRE-family HTH domain